MKLLIVLQSHSDTDNQKLLGFIDNSTLRYPGVQKEEVSKRCINSLIHSLNYCMDNINDIEIELKIFDDHSSENFLFYLTEILTNSKFKFNLEFLSEYGISNSFKHCFNYAKDNGEDLIYFAQDDYLYEESCFVEMLDLYFQFKDKSVGKSICVYPFNDPYRYAIHNIIPVRIIQGMSRHWRTSYQTASCFMLEHKTLTSEWDLFENFYLHSIDKNMEDDTLNKLFQDRQHVLFTPIPSLALHIQYETEKDPYIDWTILWNKFKPIEKIILPEKVVLNIGSGKDKLNFSSFKEFEEVSFDIDQKLNPDIVGDILNLDVFPEKSIDVVWLSHTLEHLYKTDVVDVLKNINRIIKKDGVGIIIVPNLKEISSYIATGNIHHPVYESAGGLITPIDILYGLVKDTNDPYMYHKTGFTQEYASELLTYLNINGYILENGHNLFILIAKSPIETISISIDDVLKDFYK